jgi:hypothetical protein
VGEADSSIRRGRIKNRFTTEHAENAEIQPGKEKLRNVLKAAKNKKIISFKSNLRIPFFY